MAEPLAYFLTWTTHGTWLHGDERGSVDRRHNARDRPLLGPDRAREEEARSRAGGAFLLDRSARQTVARTIRSHCEVRGWRLLAINVRSNHVHVVVACGAGVAPEAAMSQFKAWATRRLREDGVVGRAARVWTEHGSTRWIDTSESLAAAVDYVTNHQD